MARLATRLGAQVSLAAGEVNGTVARIVLPSAVFVEGSTPQATGVTDQVDVSAAEQQADRHGSAGRHAQPGEQPPVAPDPFDQLVESSFPAAPADGNAAAGPVGALTPDLPPPVDPPPVLVTPPAAEQVPEDLDPGGPRPLPRRRPGGRTPVAADIPPGFGPQNQSGQPPAAPPSPVEPPPLPAPVEAAQPPASFEAAAPAEPVHLPAPADPPAAAPRATIPATIDVLPSGGRAGRTRGLFARRGRGRTRSEAPADHPLPEPVAPQHASVMAPPDWLPSEAPDDGSRWGWAHRSDGAEVGEIDHPSSQPIAGPDPFDSPVQPGRPGPAGQGATSSPVDDVDSRSELASTALSELSMLASYRPAVGNGSPATLARRRAAPTPVESPAPPPVTIGPPGRAGPPTG